MTSSSSQNFVPIKEIQDGIVVLKDGSLRAILMASSINLSLKSEDEQVAVILQFQNYLNTLDFETQIVVQSRSRDIKPYLSILNEKMQAQTEPLLKVQTREYMQFIENLAQKVNIMTKHFFIVVPFMGPSGAGSGSFIDKILPSGGSKKTDQKDFEERRNQIEQRVSVIQQGLARTGVRTQMLKTDQAVELFYNVFNPGNAESPVNI